MKRKFATVVLMAVLLSVLLSICPTTMAISREFGQITASEVKLREEPDKDSKELAQLDINVEVEVLAEEDGWYRVLYGELVGYIRQDYVFVNSKGSRAAYVLEDGVKLRGAPSSNSYVVAELSGGKGVKVKQMIGEWYFVTVGDQSGYVNRTCLTISRGVTASSNMLKVGMEGEEVTRLQTELNKRGFLTKNDITGVFGAKTRTAVAEFQEAAGLESADGIAGAQTLSVIFDSSNKIEKENANYYRIKGTVKMLDWFKGGNEWLAKGTRFTITDVKTGLSFKARRFGGWFHADSEPVTAADTAIMKRIAGGSWSWDRRAIWVTIGNTTVAASMHCMPHMVDPNKTNNFPGHFCVHLLNSKVHETSKPCPRHQACVQEAYRAGRA